MTETFPWHGIVHISVVICRQAESLESRRLQTCTSAFTFDSEAVPRNDRRIVLLFQASRLFVSRLFSHIISYFSKGGLKSLQPSSISKLASSTWKYTKQNCEPSKFMLNEFQIGGLGWLKFVKMRITSPLIEIWASPHIIKARARQHALL